MMRSRQGRTSNAFVFGVAAGLAVATALLAGSLFFRIQAATVARMKEATGRAGEARVAAIGTVGIGSSSPARAVVAESDELRADYQRLRERKLLIPVDGYDEHQLRDSFQEGRRGHVHEAIDLPAPRGAVVRAADDGTVRRLSTGILGGITIYELDTEARYGYYYAHLERYAAFLHEGQRLRKGDVLGFVGTTGNAPPSAPHLHFSIVRIDDAGRWWDGTPINPYPIWAPPA
jgi:peptidoglycan LD-endopeptidase LytH